jgi:hypothetical protein
VAGFAQAPEQPVESRVDSNTTELPGVPMDRFVKYRRNAADCFAVAQQLEDPHLKATMLAMAGSWSALADHAELISEHDLDAEVGLRERTHH